MLRPRASAMEWVVVWAAVVAPHGMSPAYTNSPMAFAQGFLAAMGAVG